MIKIVKIIHRILTTFLNIFRTFISLFKNPEVSAIMGLTSLVILVGILFYTYIEGLSPVDAFYFTVITLATVGYGDITPHTEIGKIFTSFYVLVGVGILVVFLQVTAKQMLKENEKSIKRNKEKLQKITKK